MKGNPFGMTTTVRRQPQRKYRRPPQQNSVDSLVNGMVTIGSVAVIGGTTVGILNAFK